MTLRYGSLCSGVEAATLAWHGLGWQAAWFAEIDPFACAVLAQRWPHVPNYGDMTRLSAKILTGEIEAPDILVGGTPCQAFSVAGLRGSLEDTRGNLTIVLIRIFDAINFIRARQGKPPCLLVWENVPGVLNTKDNAFGCFLGGLAAEDSPLVPSGQKWTDAGCVLGHQRRIAWRILDAQYFGVPQRRRRVFLVASAGSADPAEILFERKGLQGDIGAGGQTGESPAAYIESSFGSDRESSVAGTVKASGGSESLIVANGRQTPVTTVNLAQAVDTYAQTNVVAIAGNIIGRIHDAGGNGNGFDTSGVCYTLTVADRHAVATPPPIAIGGQHPHAAICNNIAPTLTNAMGAGGGHTPCVALTATVRKLTPLECERLQGMPDNHTRIAWRGKPAQECPDTPRYKAIGNSMAVPVMRWIGQRIQNHL